MIFGVRRGTAGAVRTSLGRGGSREGLPGRRARGAAGVARARGGRGGAREGRLGRRVHRLRQRLDVVLRHEAALAVERAAQPAGLGGRRHVGDDLVRLEGQLALALAQARVQRPHAPADRQHRQRRLHATDRGL
ncbi:unnamed protein product [Euphydryas editha]|uniref:Uncharacterized protein n=1 Tax=Euphydryas editha TaxID=104508 RepID=A0AAU9TMP6_EUPED|nr:unnamed protein product [Euphydryas editha]